MRRAPGYDIEPKVYVWTPDNTKPMLSWETYQRRVVDHIGVGCNDDVQMTSGCGSNIDGHYLLACVYAAGRARYTTAFMRDGCVKKVESTLCIARLRLGRFVDNRHFIQLDWLVYPGLTDAFHGTDYENYPYHVTISLPDHVHTPVARELLNAGYVTVSFRQFGRGRCFAIVGGTLHTLCLRLARQYDVKPHRDIWHMSG